MPDYTPTQQRILEVLKDGRDHPRKELLACQGDEQARSDNLRRHIQLLRKKLRPIGQDVICTLGQGLATMYRHVRLLHYSSEG